MSKQRFTSRFKPLAWISLLLALPLASCKSDGQAEGWVKHPLSLGLALSVSNLTVSEADGTASVVVSAGGTTPENVTFHWETEDGAALAGTDYTASNGTATISAGSSSTTLSIPLLNDTNACEGDKSFTVKLSEVSGLDTKSASADITIHDDETPHVSIQPVAVIPGVSADFQVTLDRTCPQNLTVDYATQDGTAAAGSDYTATSGTATITAGTTAAAISVPTTSQTLASSKTFSLQISNTPVADFTVASTTGTIAAPTLDLDLTSSLPASITFSRASIATYTGADQLVHTVATDTPRFDHSPGTGATLGLLIEESRTNTLNYSEDFSQAAWIKNSVTVTGGQASPDGGTGAYDVTNSSTGGTSYMNYWLGPLPTGQYTFSIFVKKRGFNATWPTIRIKEKSVNVYRGIDFNPSDGSSNSHGSIDARGLIDYGSWYRVWFTATFPTNKPDGLQIFPALNPSGNAGTGTITIFGAQVEAGGYMTSYIPTNGSSLTRAADLARVVAPGSWFSTLGGTVQTDLQLINYNSGGTPFVVNFPDITTGGGTDQFGLKLANSGGWKYTSSVTAGGTSQVSTSDSATVVKGETLKLAAAYSANSFSFYRDGAALGTDSSGSLPASISEMTIGADSSSSGAVDASFHFTKLRYWKERLNDASIAQICQ